jgi:hypothetical protein
MLKMEGIWVGLNYLKNYQIFFQTILFIYERRRNNLTFESSNGIHILLNSEYKEINLEIENSFFISI